MRLRRAIQLGTIVFAAALLLAQAIPAPQGFGLPVVKAPDPHQSIDADADIPPSVRAIFRRSCYDCHYSGKTVWPWYSHVAPVSWYLNRHVEDGLRKLDFAEWSTVRNARGQVLHSSDRLEDLCDEVKDGSMPLRSYLLLHPSAKLSSSDRNAICGWAEK